jgi:chemotaxis protein methyltransferase CheR
LHFPRERWPDLSRAMAAMAGGDRCYGSLPDFRSLMNGPAVRRSAELLASHLAVGETYFFREPAMFEALEHEVLPPLVASRRSTGKSLRIWSAGCCSGEELYSLAIVLERTIPDLQDWNLTLLGTDIQPQFLHKARHGLYRDWSFRNVPDWIRQRYFSRDEEGNHAIAPALRRRVTFDYLNLITDI